MAEVIGWVSVAAFALKFGLIRLDRGATHFWTICRLIEVELLGFELVGDEIPDGEVIVAAGLDVFEELGPCIGEVFKAVALQHFALERSHEELGPRIVIRIGPR